MSETRAAHVLPPNVHVHFYFSSHGIAEDAPELPNRIAQADIFAPEIGGWTPAALDFYQQVSRGSMLHYKYAMELPPNEDGIGGYTKALLSALYNKHIPVMMFDVEKEHDLNKMQDDVMSDDSPWFFHALNEDFRETIEQMREAYTKLLGPLQHLRELHMIDSLVSGITDITESHPRLRNKNEVNVLVTLGSAHTFVSQVLRSSNPRRVTREFPTRPYNFPFHHRCLRAGQFGVNLPELVLAQSLAEIITQSIARKLDVTVEGKSTDEKDSHFVRAVGTLSLQEIAAMHGEFIERLANGKPYDPQHPAIAKVLTALVAT